MATHAPRPFEHLVLLRTLIVVVLVCAIWFKVAPDTLSAELRAVERSIDKPHYEQLDTAVVALLYVRSLLAILLWKPLRAVAWAFVVCEAAIFGLSAFGGPAFLSSIDSVVNGIQSMGITAIITILFISGTFAGRGRTGDV